MKFSIATVRKLIVYIVFVAGAVSTALTVPGDSHSLNYWIAAAISVVGAVTHYIVPNAPTVPPVDATVTPAAL